MTSTTFDPIVPLADNARVYLEESAYNGEELLTLGRWIPSEAQRRRLGQTSEWPPSVGVVLGLPLSVVALYVIATNFADYVPLNMPLVGLAIATIVIGVAALASWIPARKAAVVDPLVAMRVD